jgi:hypothetical protein
VSPRLSKGLDITEDTSLVMVKKGKLDRQKSPDTSKIHQRLYKKPIHNPKPKKTKETEKPDR